MNSGLPSLLDAIFGKQNLDSVSLDEIYELIDEFPSFNAGHFLLSKKLMEQNEEVYEKETMRTALYFNNPFWLESALTEGNNLISEKIVPPTRVLADDDFPLTKSSEADSVTEISETRIEEFTFEPNPPFVDQSPPVQSGEFQQSLQEETDIEKITEAQWSHQEETDIEKITETQRSHQEETDIEKITETQRSHQEETDIEKIAESPLSFQEEPRPEFPERPVRSFDDLFSKYHIEPITADEEILSDSPQKPVEQVVDEPQFTGKTDFPIESKPMDDQPRAESKQDTDSDDFITDEIPDDYEIREEVLNEYGIFEEVKVKKTDFDLEAFDRPMTSAPDNIIKSEESIPEMAVADSGFSNDTIVTEHPEVLSEKEEDNPVADEQDGERPESDYDAFDRPIDHQVQKEPESVSDLLAEEESISEIYSGREERFESVESYQEADDRGNGDMSNYELQPGHDQIPELAARFGEQQKIMSSFDPKKAESIVFAPYHMIDYFASQGIKLVIEENPVDPFAKQLKSFTDWLKVMKKLPAQVISEKTDQKEVDRIRHYAAHSINEREILTESMAEVLAKQGMYENAIALFQKLSLIYPPKSAYFASRIEQLKASLP